MGRQKEIVVLNFFTANVEQATYLLSDSNHVIMNSCLSIQILLSF